MSNQPNLVNTETFRANQDEAAKQHKILLEAFTQSGSKSPSYPAYYAGAYINDSGQLVVVVTDPSDSTVSLVKDICQSEQVIIARGHYPLTVLEEIMEQINSFAVNNPEHPVNQNMAEWYLDEEENLVSVGLKDKSEETIQAFKEACVEHPAIHFFWAEQLPQVFDGSDTEEEGGSARLKQATIVPGGSIIRITNATTIKPGDALILSSSGSRASAAMRCIRGPIGSEEVGFLSAGHFASVGNVITVNGRRVGVCTASQFGGKVDGAFIKQETTTAFDNYIGYRDIQVTKQSYVPTTSEYCDLVGSTTGHSSGRCDSRDASFNYGGITVTNTIRILITSNKPRPGDSGGLLYHWSNGSPRLGKPVGTLIGGIQLNNTFYFSRIQNALDAFGARLY